MILPLVAGYVIRTGVIYAVKKGAKYATKKAAKQALKKQSKNALDKSKKLKKGKKKACLKCKKDVKCFKKPKGMSDAEFDRQLKEQQDAINRISANKLLERRNAIQKAGGTGPLRDRSAQKQIRDNYEAKRRVELSKSGIRGKKQDDAISNELASLAATHRVDIIAGGDPSDVSGMGDRRVNSSIGSQWKGARSQELEDIARQMKKEGLGKEKIEVKLKRCK